MTAIATKMSAAGYVTAMYGKWDVGMATFDHTPRGRGFASSLNFFHHNNDYWKQTQTVTAECGTVARKKKAKRR